MEVDINSQYPPLSEGQLWLSFFDKTKAAASLILIVFLVGCSQGGLDSAEGQIMGTFYQVKWADPDNKKIDEDQVSQGISDQLTLVDQLMSTYKESSELSSLNKAPVGEWVKVSPDTMEVFKISRNISQESNGAFDPTIGDIVNLWGFGPRYERIKVPTKEQIEAKLSQVGYSAIELDETNRQVRKSKQVYVDLSAVAKGYAVDKVARYLSQLGVESYLVEVGGEVRTRGVKPDGTAWKIAIESPVVGERSIHNILEIKSKGLATSGDYRNFIVEDGVRYSHTIDPRTGYPIKHRLASVTVLHEETAYADGWATAFLVLGEEEGYRLAEAKGIAALFLVKAEEKRQFETLTTSEFKKTVKMAEE